MAGKKSIFIIAGLVVFLIGASIGIYKNFWYQQETQRNPVSIAEPIKQKPLATKDTTIVVYINGIGKAIKVDKNEVHWCLEIEKIAAEFRNRRLDTTITRYMDITGDGIQEKIVGHVYITKDSVLSDRTIFDGDSVMFSDHDGDCLNDTFGESDMMGIFNDMTPLEPYASFQEFLPFADIRNDTIGYDVKFYKNDTNIKFYIFEDILEERHVPLSEYTSEKEKFREYIVNFKGVLLNSHDEMDAIPEIWYEPGKRFIELY